MKKILISMALFALSLVAFAQNERVVLKDQTIYEGYVSNQIFGENNDVVFKIAYTAFTKNFSMEKAFRQDIVYKGDQIPSQWREWAAHNDKLVRKGNEESLTLARISFPGEPSRDYYVLIDGSKHIRCYCIAHDFADVNASEIDHLERDSRQPALLTDIDDIVTTATKSYKGIIVRQVPGKQIQIWDRITNTVNVVDNTDIVSIRKEAFNPDYTLWEQAPYLERIAIKNSSFIPQDGVIVERNLVKDSDRIVKLATKNGGVYNYPAKDIQSITKSPNPEYVAKYDIILEPGQTYVNRDSLLNFVTVLKIDNPNAMPIYYLDPQIVPEDPDAKKTLFGKKNKDVVTKDLNIVTVTEPDIVVETNTPDIEEVYVIKATERKAILVPKKNPVSILTYTDTDLIRGALKVKKEVSINQTTKLAFKVPEEGYYFIYLSGLDKSWIIQYKKTQE